LRIICFSRNPHRCRLVLEKKVPVSRDNSGEEMRALSTI